MSGVMADPAKLRDLAKRLKAAGAQIEGIRSQLTKTLQSTGWNDRERQKFEQALSNDLKTAVTVAHRLQQEYPAMLERKARALDDFRR